MGSSLLAAEPAPSTATVFDFSSVVDIEAWWSLDDRVMGGISRSLLAGAGEPGIARFQGVVSLENNGGFASVRSPIGRWELAGAEEFVLRVRGDGRVYKLCLRTDPGFDGVTYQASFDTALGEWTEVRLPVSSFLPTWRGRLVSDAPPLDPARIRTFGLMIADKQEGTFGLDVDSIEASFGPVPGAPANSRSAGPR